MQRLYKKIPKYCSKFSINKRRPSLAFINQTRQNERTGQMFNAFTQHLPHLTMTLEVLNVTVASISANLPLFEQSSSDFDNPDRKILHDSDAGDSFGLNKAELFVML